MVRRTITRWTFLVGLLALGCAPDGSDALGTTSATNTEATTDGITPAERAAGQGSEGEDYFPPEDGEDGDPMAWLEAMSSGVTQGNTAVAADTGCTPTTGYSHGSPVSICVTSVDGKLVEVNTANAYLTMREAAASAGVSMYVVSGFRSMDQQRNLYNLYLTGRGNLAAPPGYSNHQSGLALDLNTNDHGVYAWLTANGAQYGFRRTVPSEIWHWEFRGGSAPAAAPSAPATRCWSATFQQWEPQGTCVQSHLDEQWYQCSAAAWRSGRGTHGACTQSLADPNAPVAQAPAPTSCYSATLARSMPGAACVQSLYDQQWYQCTATGWVGASSSHGPAGACASTAALAGTTASTSSHTCYSASVGDNLAYASCVQSFLDHTWYQCTNNGWVSATSSSGPVGSCAHDYPLQ